jgi:hypothetical protein
MSLQQQRRGPLGRIIYFNPSRRRRCVAAKNSNGNRQLDSISVAVTVHVIMTFSPALIPPLVLVLESRAIFQRSFIPARIERVAA